MSEFEILSLVFQVLTLMIASVKLVAFCLKEDRNTKKDYPTRKVK